MAVAFPLRGSVQVQVRPPFCRPFWRRDRFFVPCRLPRQNRRFAFPSPTQETDTEASYEQAYACHQPNRQPHYTIPIARFAINCARAIQVGAAAGYSYA
eukprot:2568087-Rhodomonas_salina.1